MSNSKQQGVKVTSSIPSGSWVKRDSLTGSFLSVKMQAIAEDPTKAAKFLEKAGIITRSGNLTSHYKKSA